MALSLFAAVMEELIFRGVVPRLLSRLMGPWFALALSAILFGVLHLANPDATWIAALATAVEAGVLFGLIYFWTGRLVACIAAHFAWNFTEGYVFGTPVSGIDLQHHLLTADRVESSSSLLTGGEFGPEASIVALFLGISAAIALFIQIRRFSASANEASIR